jgi:hypothetical protein
MAITPLMAAAQLSDLPVVKRLVELGADVAAVDRTGVHGALDYARKGRNAEVVTYLKRLGATSAREPALDLAKVIGKAFGGKPKFDGYSFVLDSRLSNFRCEFHIGGSRCTVGIPNLEYIDAEFRAAENAELFMGRTRRHHRGRFHRCEDVEKILGVPVHSSIADGALPPGAALRFCSRYLRALRRLLPLSAAEEIWFGASCIEFAWVESGFPLLRTRLKAFGALVREVARQGRPESFRELGD